MAVRPWRVRLGMKVVYRYPSVGTATHQANASAQLVAGTTYVIKTIERIRDGHELTLASPGGYTFHHGQFEEAT